MQLLARPAVMESPQTHANKVSIMQIPSSFKILCWYSACVTYTYLIKTQIFVLHVQGIMISCVTLCCNWSHRRVDARAARPALRQFYGTQQL